MRASMHGQSARLVFVCLPFVVLLATAVLSVQAEEQAQKGKAAARAEVSDLEPKGKLVGEVVDRASKPVGEWPILIWDAGTQAKKPYTMAVTDSKGEYQAFLPPGKYHISPINRPIEERKTVVVIKGEPVSRAETFQFDVLVTK